MRQERKLAASLAERSGFKSMVALCQRGRHHPLPQPIALALRDPELPRDLVRIQPVLEQGGDALELAGMRRPPAPARDAQHVRLQPGLDRVGGVAVEAARLLEMDLEACAVPGLVVARMAQGEDEIEHVLAPRRAALPALLVGMVD